MIEWWDYFSYGYDQPSGGMGTATTLPVDEERDYGAELRAVVEEVTRKPCPAPQKRGIGFT